MITLAIVVPCYNEERVVEATCFALLTVLSRLQRRGTISSASRLYFVDDGSTDTTWTLIESFSARALPVVGVKLSRNSGHQNALLAGLFSADEDAVVTMDADLQDDVNVIEQMVEDHVRGVDIVYGARSVAGPKSSCGAAITHVFDRMMRALGADRIAAHADFRLMSRRAIEALKGYREVNLFLRGVVPLIGFRSSCIYYEKRSRSGSRNRYMLQGMSQLLSGITSCSSVPLRIVSFLGFAAFAGSSGMVAWAVLMKTFGGAAVAGWIPALLPLYFIVGIQSLCLAVIGEYLAKLYAESKARPRYIIEKTVAAPPEDDLVQRLQPASPPVREAMSAPAAA